MDALENIEAWCEEVGFIGVAAEFEDGCRDVEDYRIDDYHGEGPAKDSWAMYD